MDNNTWWANDPQQFTTWVLVNYQMLSTLVLFVVWVLLQQAARVTVSELSIGILCLNTRIPQRWRQRESGKRVWTSLAKLSPVFPRKVRWVKTENISTKLERSWYDTKKLPEAFNNFFQTVATYLPGLPIIIYPMLEQIMVNSIYVIEAPRYGTPLTNKQNHFQNRYLNKKSRKPPPFIIKISIQLFFYSENCIYLLYWVVPAMYIYYLHYILFISTVLCDGYNMKTYTLVSAQLD